MSVPGDRSDWMQNDPERLTQEIDATREDVGETLEALQQKLSPGQIFDQSVNFVGERSYELATRLGDTVRRNPVPFALAAVGLVWFAMKRRARGEEMLLVVEDEDDFDTYESGGTYSESGLYDQAGGSYAGMDESSLGTSTGETSQGATSRMRSAASSARSRAAGAARSVGDRAARMRGTAGQTARRASDEFSRVMHEQPLLIGAIGVAIGAAIAALIPLSETEDRLFGDASERVVQRARQKTGEQVEKVRETARRAAEGAREGARRAVSESQQGQGSTSTMSTSGDGSRSYGAGASSGSVSAGMGASSQMGSSQMGGTSSPTG